ncbi:hypothetical protein [Xanthomonas phaseoli]|uniref:hypothetical protein n=1 Tax=Xanthomonas phaseoli TaxID=1985254 RepID=UPI0012670EDA|nr:hypothetical protein [Xanthomonas phaseoli]
MRKVKANGLAAAVGNVLDKRLIVGLVIGGSLATAGYAVSAASGNSSTLGETNSTLISQEESVVAEKIRDDAEECATGDKEGTIGHSIGQAVKVHTEIASATPNVEKLFDVSGDCFSGLSQIYDLSFSIPSLATIISAAQDAVLKYAQKKVCSAVGEVTGMVTSPINEAIGKINQYGDWGNLSQLDPNLGAGYHSSGTGGTYNIGTNPFGMSQVDFGGGTGGTTGGTTGGSTGGNTGGTTPNPAIPSPGTGGVQPLNATPKEEPKPVTDEKSWRDRLGDLF